MGNYILRRIISACFVLWMVITITFFLMHAVPGGPFTEEKSLPPEVLTVIEERYNLNAPLFTQYTNYLENVISFDLGPSYKYPGRTVNEIISESFPISAMLGASGLLIAVSFGVLAGTFTAWRMNTWVDYSLMLAATLGVSVPSFIVATLLIYVFGFMWPILPVAGWRGPLSVVLPAFALASHPMAFITRLTRSSLLEVLNQDYIKTARSKGVHMSRLIFKHALRNALLPVVSYIGPLAAGLLTGSFVIENIFAIPGLGRNFVLGIYNRDYTVILGITIFYSFLVVLLNLIVDLVYPLLDPRITLIGNKEEQ